MGSPPPLLPLLILCPSHQVVVRGSHFSKGCQHFNNYEFSYRNTPLAKVLFLSVHRLSGMASHPVSPSGPGSSWDHLLLNCSQFVQLVELFLASPNPPDTIVDSLSSFIRDNYTETAQVGICMNPLVTQVCENSTLNYHLT